MASTSTANYRVSMLALVSALVGLAGWWPPSLPAAPVPRPRSKPIKRLVRPTRSRYRPHEGHGEVARRKLQIERGILTESNGLVRRG